MFILWVAPLRLVVEQVSSAVYLELMHPARESAGQCLTPPATLSGNSADGSGTPRPELDRAPWMGAAESRRM